VERSPSVSEYIFISERRAAMTAATFRKLVARTASDDKMARIWDAPPAVGQALLDQVRATLGANAPEPLKFPEARSQFVSVIGRGFSTI
jgi:hypothetical protein